MPVLVGMRPWCLAEFRRIALPPGQALHTLAQAFGQIVRKRAGHRLQDWIKQVEASSFRDVKRFTAGLQRDKEEVLAGLTLVYSNGQVEGFINKLKLIKRQGYGRAGCHFFDILARLIINLAHGSTQPA